MKGFCLLVTLISWLKASLEEIVKVEGGHGEGDNASISPGEDCEGKEHH